MSTGVLIGVVIAILVAGGVLFALTNSSEPTTPTNQNTTESHGHDPGEEHDDSTTEESDTGGVSIVSNADDGFTPNVITIKKGETVVWTNNDDMPHTVKVGGEESNQLSRGDTFSKQFDSVGTFSYECGLHSNMTGTVVVEE